MNEQTKQKITSAVLTLVGAVMWVILAIQFMRLLCR